jgi:hypothetical protein
MNVSWSDLNNVDQAGEYPFRDGTITVTFAEIAGVEKRAGRAIPADEKKSDPRAN